MTTLLLAIPAAVPAHAVASVTATAAHTVTFVNWPGQTIWLGSAAANVTHYPDTSTRMLCTNPNRDAQTAYSNTLGSHRPYAYSWPKADSVPGNQVIRQCANCTGFTITCYAPGTA